MIFTTTLSGETVKLHAGCSPWRARWITIGFRPQACSTVGVTRTSSSRHSPLAGSRGVALLAETRLLTLTGAGGCGKTRLAQRIAGRVLHRYEGGVWWTELASLADEGLIADAVAAVLGVRVPPGRDAVDALAGYLQTAPALVVIDNCEHLIVGAAAFVHRLLRSTPGTAVLATSRGQFALAIAFGLILLGIAFLVNLVLTLAQQR